MSGNTNALEPATAAEERQIRGQFDQCRVPSPWRNWYNLHIDRGGERLCADEKTYTSTQTAGRDETDFRSVPWRVYPMGNYDICDYCTDIWRRRFK